MLQELFPKAYRRYLSFPVMGSILEDFAHWLQQKGYTLKTIKESIKQTRQIEIFLQSKDFKHMEEISQKHFREFWRSFRISSYRIASTIRHIEHFIEETRGFNETISPPTSPFSMELDQYRSYLSNVRGLTPSTIRCHSRYLREFLGFINYDKNTHPLAELRLRDIDDFLCQTGRRLKRHTLQHVVAYLRGFLNYQFIKGVLSSPLHTMIDTPRVYRYEQLPRSISWELVKTLLDSIDRSNAVGIRDYTILFLIATYGLRCSDVVALKLDSIDWRRKLFLIPQQKTRNPLQLPLTATVADVVIHYLKNSRPPLPYRELFLRVRAPHGPLKPTAVSEIFQRWVKVSQLNIPFKGPHCLRHSFAVHLLHQGVSMKAIGDLLGHKNEESTCVYLPLAIEDLREVALPVPHFNEVLAPAIIQQVQTSPKTLPDRTEPEAPLHSQRISSKGWRSFLANEIQDYLRLKRSLGRLYTSESRTLHALDDFLAEHYGPEQEITAEMFNRWSFTLLHLSSSVRRRSMLQIRNFCLYCRRSQPNTFVPDILTFPAASPLFHPYLFSEPEMARLINVTQGLPTNRNSPMRAQAMRLAFILLYTCGLRREELLRLQLKDFDPIQTLLQIEASKFHKSRVIPLHPSVAAEINRYLNLRRQSQLPMDASSPLIWNRHNGSSGRRYTGTGLLRNWSFLCSALSIFTPEGKTPRIHDARHSFAVNVLQGWYREGKDVQAKLPLLSTYMGHTSIVSTHYYLRFVDAITLEASKYFYKTFGESFEPIVSVEAREDPHE